MEVYDRGTTSNAVYLSCFLNQERVFTHKCDQRCGVEQVWGNIYRCKLTGNTHICDKNCNQKIVYNNFSCVCRVSGQMFPLTQAEQQAVRDRGLVRRRIEADSADSFAPKRRREAMMHPSTFERSFSFVASICSPGGDNMDIN